MLAWSLLLVTEFPEFRGQRQALIQLESSRWLRVRTPSDKRDSRVMVRL